MRKLHLASFLGFFLPRLQATQRNALPIIGLIIFLLGSVGCSAISPADSTQPSSGLLASRTAAPKGTQSPTPLQFPESMATKTPAPTPTFETRLYTHPEGLYSFAYPSDWDVNQGNDSMAFSNPNENVSFNVFVIDTTYKLDEGSMVQLAEGREANAFSSYADYHEFDRLVDSEHDSLIISKEMAVDGEVINVTTLYRQSGRMVFILDFWSDEDIFLETEPIFTSISDSLELEEPTETNLASMPFGLYMPYDSNLFSLAVPQYWSFKHTSGNDSVVDTFISPDEHAVLQIVAYDDGQSISGPVIGAFVRNLLRNYYTDDIVVTSDRLLEDGREELIWKSPSAGYEGKSYFDMRDTTLFIITVMIDNDYVEYYTDVIDHILSTFDEEPTIEG